MRGDGSTRRGGAVAVAFVIASALGGLAAGEARAQGVQPGAPPGPTEVPSTFRHHLEVAVVLGLPIVVGDVCDVDGDLVSCTGASDLMPGGQLHLRWHFIENASIGLGTGIAVNPDQPFPKEKDKDLGNGIWVWRTVVEPRAHLRPSPVVDLWIGGQLGWAQTFFEETSTGKNKTENSGGLMYGGAAGVDFDVAPRFALGLLVQVSSANIGDPKPALKTDTSFHELGGDNVWVDVGIKITTFVPL